MSALLRQGGVGFFEGSSIAGRRWTKSARHAEDGSGVTSALYPISHITCRRPLLDKGRAPPHHHHFNSLLSLVPCPLTGTRSTNMAVKLAASIFVGFALESLLYGVFIAIFIASAITQWERWRCEKLRTGNKLVIGFSILLLVFISTVSVSRTPQSCVFKLR